MSRFLSAAWLDGLCLFSAAFLCGVVAKCARGQSPDSSGFGVFTTHGDVGDPSIAGRAAYDAAEQEYTLSAAGENMWFAQDQCHYAWKKMRGDFLVRCRVRFEGEGVDPHRKLGWLVRASLDADSPHVHATVHGDGLTSLQFRRTKGGPTEQVEAPISGAEVIQLERRGGRFVMSVARFGDEFVETPLEGVELGDEVYVGICLCSHNPEVVERAVFSNVRLVVPAPDGFRPYQDYIGSNLEVMDVATGRRQVLHEYEGSFQAPNWTVDGKALIYNQEGRLYRFDLETRRSEEIPTGAATANNNDHVLSFDGAMLGISHHAPEDGGRSNIFTVPVTGGEPKRVTRRGPSYFHGWSPDGKTLVYTGDRDGALDIYTIPADGGEETRPTSAEGVDDGPGYSPDGEAIYFNSSRTGRMQIWRMRPDGSDQTQVTDDGLNNWFPHFSPDGKQIVFLSFPSDVDAGDHPFYRRVYLRTMPVGGGPPRVIAYLYGGQGTINVPSWSPDGTKISFVSNTKKD